MVQPTPQPVQNQVVVQRAWTGSRILLFIACVLFVLAAFAAGGDSLSDIPTLSWAFGAFAAWMLSAAI
jgi:hypothetical protein